MSLRKQEWIKRLAKEGKLTKTITTEDFLLSAAKRVGASENSVQKLISTLNENAYRPLGGNELDRLLLEVILEILDAIIPQSTGHDLKEGLAKGYQIKKVEAIDLASKKKELFKLLATEVSEDKFIDLTWKVAKINEEQVLLALAPLLKRENELVRDGQLLQFSLEAGASQLTEFSGYLVRGKEISPAKNSLENFKKKIKKLSDRSMTGYSVKYIAGALKREVLSWQKEYGFCTDRRLGRYLDSFIRERVYLFLLKKYDKTGKKEVYQRFMLGYPTLEGVTIPSVRPVGEPCAGKLACTVRGAGK